MSNDFLSEDEKNISDYLFDVNDDGSLDKIVNLKRNAAGKICQVEVDFDGDDKADTKIFFEYDRQGRIEKRLTDKNMSGVINSIVIYEYDESGNAIKYYDDNADGKIDYVETPDGEIADIRDTKQKIAETAQEILKSAVNGLPLPSIVKNAVNKEK